MATKLTQEELDNLKNLKERSNSKVYEFGQLEIEMLLTHQYLESLDNAKNKLNTDFATLQTEEQDAAKALNEKYGDGSVDLEKGEFIPNESIV